MKNYLKTGLTLFLICAFFAFLLAFVNKFTSPKIKENAEKAVIAALSDVIPNDAKIDMDKGEVSIHKDGINSYYVVEDASRNTQGYVLNLEGSGYGGSFVLLAYYDKSGKLEKSKLLDNSETAGIGKKYESADNIGIFASYPNIPSTKNDLNTADSAIVSGASITFSGISSALKNGQNYIQNALKGGSSL